MTTLMVIYELYLLIFKMSNGGSYCEAYKRFLTPYVRSIPRKRKIFSSSHSLSLSFFHSLNISLLWFLSLSLSLSLSLYIYIYILLKYYIAISTFIWVTFILILQHVINTNCSKGNSRILNLKLFIYNKILHIYIIVDFVLLHIVKSYKQIIWFCL